jgi:hypothetical protein
VTARVDDHLRRRHECGIQDRLRAERCGTTGEPSETRELVHGRPPGVEPSESAVTVVSASRPPTNFCHRTLARCAPACCRLRVLVTRTERRPSVSTSVSVHLARLAFSFSLAACGTLACAQEQNPAAPAPPRHFEPFPDRWFAPNWRKSGVEPPPYEINEPGDRWNPYRQNRLKGDFPVFGSEDVFFALSVTDRIQAQFRNLPTPTGISGTGGADFFGSGRQFFFSNDLVVSAELFKGQQAFKPVDWRIKASPVFNFTHLGVEQTGVTRINVAEGDTRNTTDVALQEAFVEYHLLDLSDRYDFLSVEAGILPFRSDFRGFIFDDSNLGVRLFGNADQNKWQYNAAVFFMLDKATNSGLNNFDDREQTVFIANLYRQDWPVLGYTTQFSFHYNDDRRGVHFDDNGALVSPAPIGLAQENEVRAYYLGWTGEGHFGRINITHAFYQALGEDTRNPFAGRQTDINAQLAALELSYDIDWLRPRVFGLFASGDDDTRDDKAEGFDGILDAPAFAGGEFSFFNSQGIRLLGVNLTNPGSLFADLQSSKTEGHANFVNPGLLLLGGALDIEVTPKLKTVIGSSYLQFVETQVLETYLEIPEVKRQVGIEAFVGAQYRPLLTNNINILAGVSALFPGAGFERIYQDDEVLYSFFLNTQLTW